MNNGTAPYTPTPDAQRVIEYLRALGPTGEARSLAIARELGMTHPSVLPVLGTARRHGLLKARVEPDRTTWWSAAVESNEVDVAGEALNARFPDVPQLSVAEIQDLLRGDRRISQVPWHGTERRAQQVAEAIIPAADITAAAAEAFAAKCPDEGNKMPPLEQPSPLRIALWNDGTLFFKRDGKEGFSLSQADTQTLLRYLEFLRQV